MPSPVIARVQDRAGPRLGRSARNVNVGNQGGAEPKGSAPQAFFVPAALVRGDLETLHNGIIIPWVNGDDLRSGNVMLLHERVGVHDLVPERLHGGILRREVATFYSGCRMGDMGKAKQLWEQLDNETDAQYAGFRCFYLLDRRDRKPVNAYRAYSGYKNAKQALGYFTEWAEQFAWIERAHARDRHLDQVHLKGVEKAIEQQAIEEHSRREEVRGRLHEMLSLGYVRALEHLEQLTGGAMRTQDAVAIIKLHLETAREFGIEDEAGAAQDDWTEEDDREYSEIVEELHAERAQRELTQGKPPDQKEDLP